MKTVALSERTFQLLKSLKESEKVTFDKLIYNIVVSENRTPSSMFGKLKGKIKQFTRQEREQMWKDENRF